MPNVLGIKFRPWSRVYYYSAPKELDISLGDFVVAEGDWGEDVGCVFTISEKKEEGVYESGEVLRKAEEQDLEKLRKINEKQEDALEKCNEIVKRSALSLKIVDVYFPLNDKFIVLAFIAEERLDFRNLAREISYKFKKTARLEHISFRRAASFLKGLGVCGQELCCAHFHSFKCVKEKEYPEGLSNKFGACGCIKCCLFFEN